MSQLRVIYFGIPSTSYPRNLRVRNHLQDELHAQVVVPDLDVNSSGLMGKIRRVRSLIGASRDADFIFLAEFALKYALPAFIIARVRGARLVVDGFVGMFETEVIDWKRVRPWSLKAIAYRLVDATALLLADIYLIDTDMRAAVLEERTRGRTKVVSLPVGSTQWADQANGSMPNGLPVRMLYYGNYIPLHGLNQLVLALADERLRGRYAARFVGDGQLRRSVELGVQRLHILSAVEFVDSMPPDELTYELRNCQVVFGIFGDSEKAESVVANKVWQGLSSGRIVVTRHSQALSELPLANGGQLVTVATISAGAIADCLVEVVTRIESGAYENAPDSPMILESYVRAKYEVLTHAMTST